MVRKICKFENINEYDDVKCAIEECWEDCIGSDKCTLFIDQRAPVCKVCSRILCRNENHERLSSLDNKLIQFEDPINKYESGSVESEYICERLTDIVTNEQDGV